MVWENFLAFFSPMTALVNRFVFALVVLLVGLILGKLLGKLVHKIMRDIEVDKTLQDAISLKVPLTEIVSHAVTYIIYFIAIVMALDNLGIATAVLNILSIGIMILIILFIFLSAKDMVPNAMAGLFVHRKKFIQQGDVIEVGDVSGKVIYLNLVETRIQKANGDIIYIPNAQLTKQRVTKKKVVKKKK